MLTDCYLPQLGGIEIQVHDLSAQLGARTRGRGVHGDHRSAGRAARCDDRVTTGHVHRMAIPLPGGSPSTRSPAGGAAPADAGGFDVAHVHLGVVSPFATEPCPSRSTPACPSPRRSTASSTARRRCSAPSATRRVVEAGVALSAVSSDGGDPRELGGRGRAGRGWCPTASTSRGGAPAPRAGAATTRCGCRGAGARGVGDAPGVPQAAGGDARGAAGARAIVDPAVPLRATIVGEGPERRRHGALPADPGDGLGRAARQGRPRRAARALQSADVYLTTARLEAFGIAALEARAAGLPVLAPRGTGVDDFVDDGVEGLLADRTTGSPAPWHSWPATRPCARASGLTTSTSRRGRTGRGSSPRRCASTTGPGCARGDHRRRRGTGAASSRASPSTTVTTRSRDWPPAAGPASRSPPTGCSVTSPCGTRSSRRASGRRPRTRPDPRAPG